MMMKKKKKGLGQRSILDKWVSNAPKSMNAKDILEWGQIHPYLDVITTKIPTEIVGTGSGIKAVLLHDIKVKPPKRNILDDELYDAFPFLRTFVPRGLCIAEFNSISYQEYKMAIFAIKKFTGGPGDDDDISELLESQVTLHDHKLGGPPSEGEVAPTSPASSSLIESKNHEIRSDNHDDFMKFDDEITQMVKSRWEHYFIEPVENTVDIIETSKENGEAAHLSVVSFMKQRFFIIGSKSVHLLAKSSGDIERYKEPRYDYAKRIAVTFFEQYLCNKKENPKMKEFLKYMEENELTATFEFLQPKNMHIEFFDFKENRLKFITFTSNKHLTSLTAMKVDDAIGMAQNAGFLVANVKIHSYPELKNVFDNIRSSYGKEGSVLYYLNQKGEVIGIVKKKSIWYIMVRAIREKAKNFASQFNRCQKNEMIQNMNKKLQKTFKQKQQWLGLSDELYRDWFVLGKEFFKFLTSNFSSVQKHVRSNFPSVWNRFLKETNLSDDFLSKRSNVTANLGGDPCLEPKTTTSQS